MDNINVFNDEIYNKLSRAYGSYLSPQSQALPILTNIMHSLQFNNFGLPLHIQTKILSTLSQSQEVLNIVFSTRNIPHIRMRNNLFALIYNLTLVSSELTSHNIPSPYQTLCLKANNLILQALKTIASFFMDKNLKPFLSTQKR